MKRYSTALLFGLLSLTSQLAHADVINEAIGNIQQAINDAYNPSSSRSSDDDDDRYDRSRQTDSRQYDDRRRQLEDRRRRLDERQRQLDDDRRQLEEDERRLEDDYDRCYARFSIHTPRPLIQRGSDLIQQQRHSVISRLEPVG